MARFVFSHIEEGAHVKVTVRAGDRGQAALCGVLTMRPDEWDNLRAVIEYGGSLPGFAEVEIQDLDALAGSCDREVTP